MEDQLTAAVAAPHTVNAVCVDVENLGMRDTHYGKKEQIRITFETDEENDYGEPQFVTRVYNANMHEWSSLRCDMDSWNGRKLTEEEAKQFNAKTRIGQQCQLKLVPHNSGDRFYWNVGEIKPGKTHIEPSGIYQKRGN